MQGYFTRVEVPEVAADADVKATIGFYALNPGALYWKTFLVVDSPGLGLRKVLDAAREIWPEGGRTKTYNLGRMPDKEVGLSFFIFAHDEAAYDWSWAEYDDWLNGFSVEMTHLDSYYMWIGPTGPAPEPEPEPEPGGARISGAITKVEPSRIAFGQPLDIYVSFTAHADTIWEQWRGWDTRVTATLDGLSDWDIQNHLGRDGGRTRQSLNLGTMPYKNLVGSVLLEGRGKDLMLQPTEWMTLDQKSISVQVTTEPEPEPEPNGEPEPEPTPPIDGKPGWLLPAAIVGAAVLLLLPGKKEK